MYRIRKRLDTIASHFLSVGLTTFSLRKTRERTLRIPIKPQARPPAGEAVSFAERTLRHEFDLLGSGWQIVQYVKSKPGTPDISTRTFPRVDENRAIIAWIATHVTSPNKKHSSHVLQFLKSINPDYEPIDWQLDFKSGFRWDGRTFYTKIRFGNVPGSDVKVPWELSRFQHLSALALAFGATGEENFALEYVSQILDWIAMNPPMFGVNWKCTMDVSIRVANWIFWFGHIRPWVDRQKWSGEFYSIFFGSLHDHLKFIPKNLEWSREFTMNHYLADLAGLSILASATEDLFPESKRLREFSDEELRREMSKQVYPDGTDFEGSTCYHRLALELSFYPVWWRVSQHARYNGRNHSELAVELYGKDYVDRLHEMFTAVLYLLKPDGTMPQIGENDNGQFVKIFRRGVLDMRYLLSLGAVFFRDERLKVREFFEDEEATAELGILFGEEGTIIWNDLSWNSLACVGSRAFPHSGWYVMRNDLDYLIVSCRPDAAGNHVHDDGLSYELVLGGRNIVIDPGTYAYTSDWSARREFAAACRHNLPVVRSSGNPGNKSPSPDEKRSGCKCSRWSISSESIEFEGECTREFKHVRTVRFNLKDGEIEINDKIDPKASFAYNNVVLSPGHSAIHINGKKSSDFANEQVDAAPEYGVKVRCTSLHVPELRYTIKRESHTDA